MSLHEYDEDEMPMYDVFYDLWKDHSSLQPSKILPSTSYQGSGFEKYSKVEWYVENEICVVDPCHKQADLMCQPLEGWNLVGVIIFSGSINEDRDKLMKTMNNFVDTNSLVEICCWKAYGGELEGEAFLE